MDLPTCPACGQSVLDDDAAECPFCGAAMDGSSPGRKPATTTKKSEASATQTPAKEKSAAAPAADEDPFAIQQAPAAKKAIACAPRPMKGRRQRVVCPMCDTPGYIPKAALGRSVRCANKQCMVPVFTAVDPEEQTDRVPERISDEETAISQKRGAAGGVRNPLVVYGVVGGLLLAAAVGLMIYLNQEAVTELGPADITITPVDDDDDNQTGTPAQQSNDNAPVDHRKQALAIIAEMIDAARSNRNNDKPTSRRLTGDSYLRLDMREQAEAEFVQMNHVARLASQDVRYYPIVPWVQTYWRKTSAGEKQAADTALAAARALKDTIPASGGFPMETSVTLAAAEADSGNLPQAFALIEKQTRDHSVAAHLDAERAGAWRAVALMENEMQRESWPVLEVFQWHGPLSVATVAQLTARQRWTPATEMATAITDEDAAADALAVVAAQAVHRQAPAAVRAAVRQAAQKTGDHLLLRICSILARDPQAKDMYDQASTVLAGIRTAPQRRLKSIPEELQSARPDTQNSHRTATAIADYIIAAIRRDDGAAATAAFRRMGQVLTEVVPLSAEVRQAAGEIENNEGEVRKRIAQEFALSDANAISRQFLKYRRVIDRMVLAAEERQLHLARLLTHIIENGGLEAVRQEVANPESLIRKELYVDTLRVLLYVAAFEAGQDFAEILEPADDLSVPLARVSSGDRLEDYVAALALAKTIRACDKSGLAAVNQMAGVAESPGLRGAFATRIAETVARRTENPQQALSQVLKIELGLWKHRAFAVVAETLADRGFVKELRQALTEQSLVPDQQVRVLHGIVRQHIARISQ